MHLVVAHKLQDISSFNVVPLPNMTLKVICSPLMNPNNFVACVK